MKDTERGSTLTLRDRKSQGSVCRGTEATKDFPWEVPAGTVKYTKIHTHFFFSLKKRKKKKNYGLNDTTII